MLASASVTLVATTTSWHERSAARLSARRTSSSNAPGGRPTSASSMPSLHETSPVATFHDHVIAPGASSARERSLKGAGASCTHPHGTPRLGTIRVARSPFAGPDGVAQARGRLRSRAGCPQAAPAIPTRRRTYFLGSIRRFIGLAQQSHDLERTVAKAFKPRDRARRGARHRRVDPRRARSCTAAGPPSRSEGASAASRGRSRADWVRAG